MNDRADTAPRPPLLDALGANHVLKAHAGMIARWQDDPNLDCRAEARKVMEQSDEIHRLLVAAAPDAPADCECGVRPHEPWCDRSAASAPQALDVERARQAFGAHDAAHRGVDGLHPESCDEWIADMYARLSRLTSETGDE